MLTRWFGIFCLSASALLATAQVASGDPIQDPFLDETQNLTNTCPANCASVVLATDPISGKTTVEYVLQLTPVAPATVGSPITVTAGDVKVAEFGSSTVGDVLRFEDVTISNVLRGVVFLFSGDGSNGIPYDADVGLPSSFQTNFTTISENSIGQTATYSPTSGQPGYCGASCSLGYVLNSPDVPEPLTLSIFGAGLFGAAAIRRRRKQSKA
jgi:hypothetical protein